MGVLTVSLHQLKIPFRFKYGHSKANHTGVHSVFCVIKDKKGVTGVGEAVPRRYVTGESPESVFHDLKSFLRGENSSSPLDEMMLNWKAGKDYQYRETGGWLTTKRLNENQPHPSCALACLNTALLDWTCRRDEISLFKRIGGISPSTLTYTASVGFGSKIRLLPLLMAYKYVGFRKFKLKVGNTEDLERIKWIQNILGKDASYYADANGAWEKDVAPGKIEKLKQLGIWAIEEPLNFDPDPAHSPMLDKLPGEETIVNSQVNREVFLNASHYENYNWLRSRSALPIIADESLISPRTCEKITSFRAFDILNIRISKCGGILTSIDMIQRAKAAGLKFGICAMVGESGILAMAGSHLAAAFPDYCMLQGHSHRLLHRYSLVKNVPHVKRGGMLTLTDRPGLGIEPDLSLLKKLSLKKFEVEVEENHLIKK